MHDYHHQFRLIVLAAFGLTVPLLSQTTVSGVVTGADTGSPLPRVTVIASAVHNALAPTSSKPTIFSAQTADDGSFAFPSVIQGSYRVCTLNAGDYLNPCEWPSASDIGVVKIANSDPKLKLKLDRGRRVHLRLEDPKLALQVASVAGKKPEAIIGIVDTRGKVWRRANPLGTASAWNFTALVPNDPSYGFATVSADVNISDHAGVAVADKTFIPFAPSLTADQRAQLRALLRKDPEDPAVLLKVVGPKHP